MKKFIFYTCCIIVCLSCIFLASWNRPLVNALKLNSQKTQTNQIASAEITHVPWDKLSEKEKCNYQFRILKKFLYPYLQEAVNEYYGEFRQYSDVIILSIEPDIYGDILKMQVHTFVGAHNPPYGIDTITLYQESSGAVEIQDFTHKDMDY
jgi:internalin A